MTSTQADDEFFIPIAPSVKQAIEVLRLLYEKSIKSSIWQKIDQSTEIDINRISKDLTDLESSSQKTILINQCSIIWNQVVGRKIPSVWFIRRHQPITVLLSAICYQAEISIAHVIGGKFSDRDYDRLEVEIGKLKKSPLKICDASQPDSFQMAFPALISSKSASLVICDWTLAGEELAMTKNLSQDQNISILYPC
jgi:hypothetical protein